MKKLPSFNLSEFTSGLFLPFKGLAYLFNHRGLKRYAFLPFILNVFLYGIAALVFLWFLANWEISLVAWDFWGPVGRWLSDAINWMGWMVKLVVAMVAIAAAYFTFSAVGMVIASPFNDILSEKVEVVYCGSDGKVSMPLRFTVQASMLSIYDSFRTMIRQLLFTAVCHSYDSSHYSHF